jgi:hypothetical protein
MRIDFDDLRKPVGDQRLLQSWERIPAGSHTWTRIKVNGKEIDTKTDRLNGALEPDTAFFVQAYYKDYSKASAQPGDPSNE